MNKIGLILVVVAQCIRDVYAEIPGVATQLVAEPDRKGLALGCSIMAPLLAPSDEEQQGRRLGEAFNSDLLARNAHAVLGETLAENWGDSSLAILQPSDTTQRIAFPGTFTILSFPLYEYADKLDEHVLKVIVTVSGTDEAESGHLDVVLTPLQWYCELQDSINVPVDEDSCTWEGDGRGSRYSHDLTISAGGTVAVSLDPRFNATLYPATWYDTPSLYFRVLGPEVGTAPLEYNIHVTIEDNSEQLEASSTAQVGLPTAITPSSLPRSVSTTDDGLIKISNATTVQVSLDVYEMAHIFIPLSDSAASHDTRISVSAFAETSDIQVWITPLNYNCTSGHYLEPVDKGEKYVLGQSRSYISHQTAPSSSSIRHLYLLPCAVIDCAARYYFWTSVPLGTSATFTVTPNDGSMYPTGAANSSGLWIGVDALRWGETALCDIEVVMNNKGAASDSTIPPASLLSIVATELPLEPPPDVASTDVAAETATSDRSVVVFSVVAGVGSLVAIAVVIGAFTVIRRKHLARNNSGSHSKDSVSENPLSGGVGAAAGRSTGPTATDPEHVTTPRIGGGHASVTGTQGNNPTRQKVESRTQTPPGAGIGSSRGAGGPRGAGGVRGMDRPPGIPRRPPTPAPLDYLPSSPAFRE